MKKYKILLSLIFIFAITIIAFSDEPSDGCSMECPNGKTLSVSPCTTCEVYEEYLACDYENYWCPFG